METTVPTEQVTTKIEKAPKKAAVCKMHFNRFLVCVGIRSSFMARHPAPPACVSGMRFSRVKLVPLSQHQWEFNAKAQSGKGAKWMQRNPKTGLRQFALTLR